MILGWTSFRFLEEILIRRKTWPLGGGAYFHYILYSANLKKSSSWKPLIRFGCNLVWMILWWTSFRFLEEILIRRKTWPLGGGAYFHYILYSANLKNLLLRNFSLDLVVILYEWPFGECLSDSLKKFWSDEKYGCILLLFGMNDPWVNLFVIPWSNYDPTKNMAPRGRGLFSLYTV